MREKGFISNRIFDAIACGAYVISDEVSGLDELFEGRVDTYETVEQLNQLIEDGLKNPKEVNNDISGHTYNDRVNQFMDLLNKEL